MTGLKDLLRLDRARHSLVALAVAGALGVTGFLNPLDWLIWATHGRILERPASGEIVFVGGVDDLSDPTRPQHRRALARLIEGLNDAGAEKVFLDIQLEELSDTGADEALRRALERSERNYLVDRFKSTVAGPRMLSTIPLVAGASARVVAIQRLDLFGWTWSSDRGAVIDGAFRQSFAGALAD